ncbi:MAG: AMP-binding protein [Clostridia bacterium]|nr:AMP-binding protein [Clostridia bacterium]
MIKIEELLKSDYQKWKSRDYIFEKKNEKYESITFGNFVEKVVYLADYLIDKNLKDKKIIIFSENSINWMISDVAIMSYVGESVTVSKEWKYEELKEVLNFLDISCIIYSDTKKDVIEKIKLEFPDMIYICMQSDFKTIFEKGQELNSKKFDMFDFEPKEINSCSKIIFTSGTTSSPKAVMLSLKNIFSGYESLKRRVLFDENDVCYLFLPLTHTYGNIYNFIFSLISGYTIYLASSTENISKELLEVNPTIFCAVPLIYVKMYEGYKDNIDKAFGTRIKYLFCGGAHFDETIRKIYKDKKLNIMEAYALSETSSSFSIEYPYTDDTRSVGTIFEDIDVKILNPDENGNGEIAVKGDNVFLGYANNQELTNRVFTQNGYFLTGDIGYIKDKKLYITGRKKNVIIGTNGENISPEILEKKIKELSPNINSVKIFLDKDVLSCYVYIRENDNADWDKVFEQFNKNIPKYEVIKKYEIIVDSVDKRLKQ